MFLALSLSAALIAQVPTPPASFQLKDSVYGNVTMTRIAPNRWSGINAAASLPNNPCCGGPVNFAIRYALSTAADTPSGWKLVVQYRTDNFTTYCPIASSASDPPNVAYEVAVSTDHPENGDPSATFTSNGTRPGTQAWPAYKNVTLSVILP